MVMKIWVTRMMLGCRSWPMMDDNRGKVLFVLVDSTGKYGPLYRQQFPDLRNATFFVSQPGERFCRWSTICDTKTWLYFAQIMVKLGRPAHVNSMSL